MDASLEEYKSEVQNDEEEDGRVNQVDLNLEQVIEEICDQEVFTEMQGHLSRLKLFFSSEVVDIKVDNDIQYKYLSMLKNMNEELIAWKRRLPSSQHYMTSLT